MITVSNRRIKKPKTADEARRTIYAGRPGRFGNPFVVSLDPHNYRDRDCVIDSFTKWFTTQHSPAAIAMRSAATFLPDDAILECWCHPLRCHAHVIADWENKRRGFTK